MKMVQLILRKTFLARQPISQFPDSWKVNWELLAFGEIYTFGPTFRAENSNTTRHLAEFWMIEPEMAFYDLNDNMDLAEEFLKYLITYALENCTDDLAFLGKRLNEEEKNKPQDQRSMELIEKLKFVVNNKFYKNYIHGSH